jgi:chemotaxis protein histidine kinase CheA
MAIKVGKTSGPQVPEKLEKICDRGYLFATLEKSFKAKASGCRKEYEDFLEHNEDGFDLTEKTLKTTNGSVTLTERSSYEWDVDGIQDLIDNGHVTLTTILQCCSFRAKDLQTALGSNFESVQSQKTSRSYSFKPNSEFKADAELKAEAIEQLDGEQPVASKPKEKKPFEKIANKKDLKESIATAKAAAKKSPKKKAAKKTKSADSDLDDIIG